MADKDCLAECFLEIKACGPNRASECDFPVVHFNPREYKYNERYREGVDKIIAEHAKRLLGLFCGTEFSR